MDPALAEAYGKLRTKLAGFAVEPVYELLATSADNAACRLPAGVPEGMDARMSYLFDGMEAVYSLLEECLKKRQGWVDKVHGDLEDTVEGLLQPVWDVLNGMFARQDQAIKDFVQWFWLTMHDDCMAFLQEFSRRFEDSGKSFAVRSLRGAGAHDEDGVREGRAPEGRLLEQAGAPSAHLLAASRRARGILVAERAVFPAAWRHASGAGGAASGACPPPRGASCPPSGTAGTERVSAVSHLQLFQKHLQHGACETACRERVCPSVRRRPSARCLGEVPLCSIVDLRAATAGRVRRLLAQAGPTRLPRWRQPPAALRLPCLALFLLYVRQAGRFGGRPDVP